MTERKRNRRKKDDESKDDDKASPAEYDVAKYLRSKLPEKQTTLMSHKVNYFIASKAIDCLLDSPWATRKSKSGDVMFTSRDSIINFMDVMLRHKFFHRAKKIVVQKDKKKKKDDETDDGKKKKKEDEVDEGKKKKKDVDNEETKSKKKDDDERGSGEAKTKKEEVTKKKDDKSKKTKDDKKDTDEKKKKKIKLDMHLEQEFVDGNEPFVWIYDPIPVKAWIIGTLMVVGAVLVCLFPLWPKIVRHYVYYLSVAAAGFLVFIIALAVIRLVVFVLVWLLTFGKHHLWLLPNLTEDVGFFDSFWPLYKYEFKGKEEESTSDQEGKDSDAGESEQDTAKDPKDTQDNGFEILEANDESDREDHNKDS